MRNLTHMVAGDRCTIHIPERPEDMGDFTDWMANRERAVLAVDTETTGLGVFGLGFGLRLLQIGDALEAWVLREDLAQGYGAHALRGHAHWVAHNWSYDAQVVERCLGVTIEEMTPKMFDTLILSKLAAPHRKNHALKPLSEEYVDPDAVDTQEGLEEVFKSLRIGHTKQNGRGWAAIPIDNETYLRYAGLDVIYCSRLFAVLAQKAKELLVTELAQFELTIQGYLNVMRRHGLRVDPVYAAAQRDAFHADAEEHFRRLREDFGLLNPNSHTQLSEALLRSGAELTETTPSGAFSTSKDVLWPLAGLDEYGQEIEGFENPNELAFHAARGQRAERFASNYLGKFLDLSDANGFIHPNITGLQARTSRMAVSDPPLQQLPSGDWKVRRAIIADPGNVMISADYAQIEMRLVAELAGVRKMKEAILGGLDLHAFTAELAYGAEYTDQNRTHMKKAGFGTVYGGGAAGLAKQTGLTVKQAAQVVRAYKRTYPEIERWSLKLQREARRNGMVMRSATGRILALDRNRVYAAINYQIQSLAADVLKNALEAMFSQGLGGYLRMPVHDEVVAEAPEAEAESVIQAIREAMQTKVMDMPLDSDAEVYGRSWGHGYAKKDHEKAELATFDYTLEGA